MLRGFLRGFAGHLYLFALVDSNVSLPWTTPHNPKVAGSNPAPATIVLCREIGNGLNLLLGFGSFGSQRRPALMAPTSRGRGDVDPNNSADSVRDPPAT